MRFNIILALLLFSCSSQPNSKTTSLPEGEFQVICPNKSDTLNFVNYKYSKIRGGWNELFWDIKNDTIQTRDSRGFSYITGTQKGVYQLKSNILKITYLGKDQANKEISRSTKIVEKYKLLKRTATSFVVVRVNTTSNGIERTNSNEIHSDIQLR